MKQKKRVILFLLIIVIGSSFIDLFSQNTQTKPTRQSSLEAFSKGNYEQAYTEFSELLLTYSKDPLYKYYSGVCLIKLNRTPEEAVILLQQALQGASVVRTLPSDALFYLGRAQQMSGKFQEAVGSYNLYTEQIGKKVAREQGVPELIQQCNEKKGVVKETVLKSEESVKTEEPAVNEAIQLPVKKEIPAKSNLPAGYEQILEEALDLQFKADSLNVLTSRLKREYDKLPNADKPALKVKISENELLAASFQKSADQKYNDALVMLNPQQDKAPQKVTPQQSDNKIISDQVKPPGNGNFKEAVKPTGTVTKIDSPVKKPVEIFSYFNVITAPFADPNEKMTIDPEVPAGLIYRIQVAVFRNPVAPSYFKGITPVYGFEVSGTDRTNYYAGMFRRYSDANKALVEVKARGFKDAFVVALFGNKPVSADRAVILEQEWGKKPFVERVKKIPESGIDTIPPVLSFRVEVIRSMKPLKDDIVEGIKKITGNRGLDIQYLDDGNIVYLIGKFITFDSVSEYADLLVRNGYREARVVAWLGKKEIPVETARQLFDDLE